MSDLRRVRLDIVSSVVCWCAAKRLGRYMNRQYVRRPQISFSGNAGLRL